MHREHFEVLSCGVKDLHAPSLGQECPQRLEIYACQRIDERAVIDRSELHEAQLGIVAALAHELGVNRDECALREFLQRTRKARVGVDEHGRLSAHERSTDTMK